MAATDKNHSDSSSSSDGSQDEGEQIRVSFLLDSSIKDRSLEVPSEPIAVPSTLGHKGISAVINHLLDRDDDNEVIPFDCLVQNKLLRTGIETAARRHGLSLEKAVQITYFPAQTAPESRGESEPMPDWISALVHQQGLLMSGGYNGSICIFEKNKINEKQYSLDTVSSTDAHSGPIKCMSAVPKDDTTMRIATGSLDHTLKTHTWDSKTNELKLHAEYRDGHTSSIGSVDLQKQGNLMASGDWDGGLCLWDYMNDHDIATDEPTKKLKTGAVRSSTSSNGVATVAPKVVLQAHASQISGVSWGTLSENDATLVTGSWDHSLKVWDMERQDCLLTLNGSRVVACLDTSKHSQVVATGHPDCTVRLWDVRVGGTNKQDETVTITTDASLKPRHKAWVADVKWCPNNPYVLASTSHDGTVKIWDIRSSLPLFSVRVHGKEEKGLCLAYGDDGIIYAGGTDCVVKQYSSSNDY